MDTLSENVAIDPSILGVTSPLPGTSNITEEASNDNNVELGGDQIMSELLKDFSARRVEPLKRDVWSSATIDAGSASSITSVKALYTFLELYLIVCL
jgi:hypothetical protein